MSVAMVSSAGAELPSASPDAIVSQIDVKKGDFWSVVNVLAEAGFLVSAEVIASEDKSKFTFSFKNQPLRVVLDEIIHQAPEYEWRLRDGVIGLAPKREFLPGVYSRTLDAQLPRFASEEKSVTAAIQNLADAAKKRGLPFVARKVRARLAKHEKPGVVSVRVERKATVREILDVIIRTGPSGLWFARPSPDGESLLVIGQCGKRSGV